MSRHIQKDFNVSLNDFKLLSMCAKFQVNKYQFSTQKKYDAFFIRLWGIRDSLATAELICHSIQ